MNHKPGSVTNRLGLARSAIYLGPTSQPASVQPTRGMGRAALPLLDFAPDEVCRIFFSQSRKIPSVLLPVPWWALTPPFHPYRADCPLNEPEICQAVYFLLRCLSKSLNGLKDRPAFLPGITRHHALRSPDFPLPLSSRWMKMRAASWFIVTIYSS